MGRPEKQQAGAMYDGLSEPGCDKLLSFEATIRGEPVTIYYLPWNVDELDKVLKASEAGMFSYLTTAAMLRWRKEDGKRRWSEFQAGKATVAHGLPIPDLAAIGKKLTEDMPTFQAAEGESNPTPASEGS